MARQALNHMPLIKAGTFLGIGMGGFFDGILFHQILQLHGMLTGKLPKTTIANVEINMFWDGMFHALTWTMTAVGIWLLFRTGGRADVRWLSRIFGGAFFLGWGLFNLIEGVIDHYLLNLHHLYEAQGQSIYDLIFLLSGVVFIVGGLLSIRSRWAPYASRQSPPRARTKYRLERSG